MTEMDQRPNSLEALLVRDEGETCHLYYDHGVPHIGVGANLTVKVPPEIAEQITIPQSASRALLRLRIQSAATDLNTHLPWTLSLDEVRRAALVSIVYNMGIDNLLAHNAEAVTAIQMRDYEKAKRLMLGQSWQAEVGDRAVRLMDMLVTGEWT